MNKLILVVASSDDVRYLLAQILRDSGYSIIESAESTDAWNQAQNAPVTMVIMDLDMPIANGLELVRRLRTEHPNSEIPILGVYGQFALCADYQRGEFQIQEWIEKPFSAESILEAAGKYLPVYCLVADRPLRKGPDRRQAERRKN